MANNTDLVKEIEAEAKIVLKLNKKACLNKQAQCLISSAELVNIYGALQRARDAITKAQGELVQLSESTDSMGHPVFARQLMDIHDILSAYTPEEK